MAEDSAVVKSLGILHRHAVRNDKLQIHVLAPYAKALLKKEGVLMEKRDIAGNALDCFAKGYNCAESLIVAFNPLFDGGEIDIALVTPFGAGLGGRRDLCGIIIAGTLIIGKVYGRHDPADIDRKVKAYKLAGAYYRWFKEEFGAVRCREIVPGKFTGHTAVCENIMGRAAEYLAEIV